MWACCCFFLQKWHKIYYKKITRSTKHPKHNYNYIKFSEWAVGAPLSPLYYRSQHDLVDDSMEIFCARAPKNQRTHDVVESIWCTWHSLAIAHARREILTSPPQEDDKKPQQSSVQMNELKEKRSLEDQLEKDAAIRPSTTPAMTKETLT